VRRGVLLVGVWVAGVVIAVSLAFAAVARVANGVAPNDVAHLSKTQVDNELTGGTTPPPRGSTSPTSRATTTTSSPGSTPTSTATTSSTMSTAGWSTPTTHGTTLTAPPLTAWSPTSRPTSPTTATTVAKPPPVTPHNTVTTSQGGTIYTRCTGPETIAYVAAVPKTGYARTVDIELPTGIEQTIANGQHASTIQAECSNGVVHAEVEEEVTDG
jgi:hypothetical protein